MGIRGKGNRALDTVELFKSVRVKNDIGKNVDTMLPVGSFGANVEHFTGSRFAYFKTLGYNHPVQITMYRPDIEFAEMRLNGSKVEIKSVTEDKENRNKIIILGDIVDGSY